MELNAGNSMHCKICPEPSTSEAADSPRKHSNSLALFDALLLQCWLLSRTRRKEVWPHTQIFLRMINNQEHSDFVRAFHGMRKLGNGALREAA